MKVFRGELRGWVIRGVRVLNSETGIIREKFELCGYIDNADALIRMDREEKLRKLRNNGVKITEDVVRDVNEDIKFENLREKYEEMIENMENNGYSCVHGKYEVTTCIEKYDMVNNLVYTKNSIYRIDPSKRRKNGGGCVSKRGQRIVDLKDILREMMERGMINCGGGDFEKLMDIYHGGVRGQKGDALSG